jgi:hypothetical protein
MLLQEGFAKSVKKEYFVQGKMELSDERKKTCEAKFFLGESISAH